MYSLFSSQALEILVKHFPKYLSQQIGNILPPVWTIFTQSVDQYIKTTINCIDSSDDVVDEDGNILYKTQLNQLHLILFAFIRNIVCMININIFIFLIGEILSFENLVYSTFEFIVSLVESSKFKKTVEQYLEDILFFTMVYMQVTDEQVRTK